MDKDIIKNDQKQKAEYLNLDGNLVEKKAAIVLETQTQIELVERKLDEQQVELERVTTENQELTTLLEAEREKNNKLKTIAEEKYNLDLTNVDIYLPKGKEFFQKVHKLAFDKIQDAKK